MASSLWSAPELRALGIVTIPELRHSETPRAMGLAAGQMLHSKKWVKCPFSKKANFPPILIDLWNFLYFPKMSFHLSFLVLNLFIGFCFHSPFWECSLFANYSWFGGFFKIKKVWTVIIKNTKWLKTSWKMLKTKISQLRKILAKWSCLPKLHSSRYWLFDWLFLALESASLVTIKSQHTPGATTVRYQNSTISPHP